MTACWHLPSPAFAVGMDVGDGGDALAAAVHDPEEPVALARAVALEDVRVEAGAPAFVALMRAGLTRSRPRGPSGA